MIIEHAHKKAKPVKLKSLANFGRPSGSGTKKGFKRIRNQKNISDPTNVSTLYPSINQNERKPKNEGNESNISKKKSSPLKTSRTQLSKLSNLVNVEK